MSIPPIPSGVLPPGASLPQQTPSLASLFFKAVEGFPRFLFLFVLDLVHAALADPLSLALTIACVLVGLVTGSWMIGLAVYLFVFVAAKTINNLAAAIATAGGAVSGGVSGGLRLLAQSNESRPPGQ